MKICFIANVDFAMRHFILPLMRGARARGHEVVGLCAEGPLLDAPRAEGFRIEAMPMARSMNPLVQFKAYQAVRDFLKRENCDLVHAHMPISGLIGRAAARAAGVPRIAYTCHGFLFNQPGPWWRRSLALQGGAMSDAECAAFECSPHHKPALLLRVWDEQAKQAGWFARSANAALAQLRLVMSQVPLLSPPRPAMGTEIGSDRVVSVTHLP